MYYRLILVDHYEDAPFSFHEKWLKFLTNHPEVKLFTNHENPHEKIYVVSNHTDQTVVIIPS